MEIFFISKLPGMFSIFSPLVDFLPIIPIFFFYLHLLGKQVLDLDNIFNF